MALGAGLQVVKWLIVAATVLGSLLLLQPLVRLIAGEDTTFAFSGQLNVSLGVNIAAGVAVVELIRQNRRLRRQVRRLEGQRPNRPQTGRRGKKGT